MTLKKNVK